MEKKSSLSSMIEKAQNSETFLAQKISVQFARNVEILMLEKGLKQKDLAERMKVPSACVSKILSGDINMTLATMSKVANALECDFYDFFKNRF